MSAMDRRTFLKALGAGAAAALAPGWLRAAPAADAGRPNIVLIMADDMGYSDIGPYGGEIQTPNLDRLAGRGIRFTQFYNNAKCGPTRASLLTGLYSQQVGEGAMRNAVTLAEVLKPAGYHALMAGKWHADNIPVNRGFERYFGLADGCCNYWNPGQRRQGEGEPGRKSLKEARRWAIDDKVYKGYTPEDKNFYTTDAFTDYALKYLDQYGRDDRPFFLYLAYTSPHYPLHAWPEDIAKYRGKYKVGWDVLRKQRYERMVKMGLIDPKWGMSDRDDGLPAWADTPDQDGWDLKMAVYAAMIDRMDRNIGRVMEKVRQLGKEDNTLVLFLSDNGGCAENVNRTPNVPPGPLESYRTVDRPWANASNTPFRKYKSWNHEGGIATPLIASWPARIESGGTLTNQVGHIIDIMATCADLGGAKYPSEYNGQKILPLEGKSLAPIFDGRTREGHETIYWAYGGCRAVRQGKWKLVARGKAPWELYDMEADRTELHDLSAQQPDRAKALAALHDAWAQRCKQTRTAR